MAFDPKIFVDADYFRQKDFDVSSDKIRDYVNDKPRYGIKFFSENFTFPDTKINTSSFSRVITFVNNGYDDITSYSIQMIGDFELLGKLPKIINPNEVINLEVAFKPTMLGNHQGAIYIDAFCAIGTSLILLNGKGVE